MGWVKSDNIGCSYKVNLKPNLFNLSAMFDKEMYIKSLSKLPVLEIEHLNAKSIQEGKQDCETNQSSSHWPHEIRVIPEIMFNIPFDAWIQGNSRDFNTFLQITILGHYQSIHCPCHRADPIVPYPPLWYSLHKINNKFIRHYRANFIKGVSSLAHLWKLSTY